MRWLIDGLKSSMTLRANLPIWGSPETQLDYIQSVKQELVRALEPDLIGRFIAELDACASPRPTLRLPDAATPSGLKVGQDTYVRLSSAGRVVSLGPAETGKIAFKYCGKVVHCSESLLPILDLLNDGLPHGVREFSAVATYSNHAAEILEFIGQLTDAGVLITEAEARSC